MGRLPPVCHILKPQQLRDNIRLGAIGVSPAETTRCSDCARDARSMRGVTLRDPTVDASWSRSRGAVGVAEPEPPAHTTASRSRTAPWCSSTISANYCS